VRDGANGTMLWHGSPDRATSWTEGLPGGYQVIKSRWADAALLNSAQSRAALRWAGDLRSPPMARSGERAI